MRAPTDEDLADDFIDSASGKAYRKFGRHWELTKYIREFLEVFAWLENADDFALTRAVNRVAHVIRSRNAHKAARTRKKKAESAKEARRKMELEESSPLLPGLK